MTCSRAECTRESAEGDRYCAECRAEYMRDYRRRSRTQRDRAEHHRGFEEGLAAAAAFLRVKIGGVAYTGYSMAVLLEREHLRSETPDQAQRRAFLDAIRSTQPQQ